MPDRYCGHEGGEREPGPAAAGARLLSRRALLLAAGACGLPWGAAGCRPLRVGVVAGLGLEAPAMEVAGRAATLVPFASWGTLRDHASLPGDRPFDAAVLPQGDGAGMPLSFAPRCAVLLAGPAAAPDQRLTVGIALASPGARAAADRALGRACALVELPPAALVGNVAAGLLDAAILVGSRGFGRLPGLTLIPLAAPATLLPPLALVRCPVGPPISFAGA